MRSERELGSRLALAPKFAFEPGCSSSSSLSLFLYSKFFAAVSHGRSSNSSRLYTHLSRALHLSPIRPTLLSSRTANNNKLCPCTYVIAHYSPSFPLLSRVQLYPQFNELLFPLNCLLFLCIKCLDNFGKFTCRV